MRIYCVKSLRGSTDMYLSNYDPLEKKDKRQSRVTLPMSQKSQTKNRQKAHKSHSNSAVFRRKGFLLPIVNTLFKLRTLITQCLVLQKKKKKLKENKTLRSCINALKLDQNLCQNKMP